MRLRQAGPPAMLVALVVAGCTGGHNASRDATRGFPLSPSTASFASGYPSAVAAVRATCHTDRLMFHGRVLPPLRGQRGSRVGWQTPDQAVGFGWTALVQMRGGRYFVIDCKSQSIVHG